MGLNEKEIPFYFLRMIELSIQASFTFIRRRPLISGVLLISCSLYLFLSYIYHFIVYLSPFLVCAAIFVRIFWSSEEGQFIYMKKDEKKEEPKEIEKQRYKRPNYGKSDMLPERRCLSRNATSRRRNFTDKKLDVQDAVVEAKVLESSTIESCDSKKEYAKSSENEENSSDFAEKLQNTDTQISPLQSEASISELAKASDFDQQNNKSDCYSDGLASEEEKSSSDSAGKSQNTDAQVWPSEPDPSISDQVKTSYSDQHDDKSDGCSGEPDFEKEDTVEAKEEKEEEGEDEGEGEGEESQDEEANKAVEWSKDDQKNLMDLGISEMERNQRLESLIARRRAKQQMKLQMEQGPTYLRASPSRMAPLNITRTDPLKSPRNYGGIDGLEIPGSAPSALRPSQNPFDLPYDACEEKPNLTGGSFHQEFTSKDMAFRRHESFSYGASLQFDQESQPFFINGRRVSDRFRRLSDKGNHNRIIEKLFSKNIDSSDNMRNIVKAPKPLLVKFDTTTDQKNKAKNQWKKLLNATQVQKSFSHHTCEPSSTFREEEEEQSKTPQQHHYHEPFSKKFFNFPIATSTAICEASLDSPSSATSRNQEEDMPFPHRCIFHKPTGSIASDLQVELSEIGSPTALTTDGESVVFDGEDIDKEESVLSPRSDDLEPISIKLRSCEEGIAEMNNDSQKSSPIPLRQKVEEDVIDVSSHSSTSDLHGDSPTHAKINYDYNIFSDMRKHAVETQATLTSNSLIGSGRSLDHPPHETQPQKPEERQNLSENSETEAHVGDHRVSSSSSTSDSHGDTPTHEKINYDYNVFSDVKKDEVETQTTHPSDFLIGRSLDHPPHETRPQHQEERQNLSENEAQVVDHHVSSSSSTSESHGDTPTHEKINYDYNVFSDVKKDEVETQATQTSNSSDLLISRSLDYSPHGSQSKKPEERQNLSENSETEAQILDHHVTDSSNTDEDNSHSNEDLRPPVVHQHQESIDAMSMNTFSSLSPRSLSPETTPMDHVTLPAFNQHISTDVPQLNIEDVTQEPPTSELPFNTMPPILQPLSIDPAALTLTSVSGDFQDSAEEKSEDKLTSMVRQDGCIQSLISPQMKTSEEINNESEVVENDEVTSTPSKLTENDGISTTIKDGQKATELTQLTDVNPPNPNKPTMADDYNTTDKSIFDGVDRKENDTLIISRNMDPAGGKGEDKSASVVIQDDFIQSISSPQMKTLVEDNNKSKAIENDEVTSNPAKVAENVGISTIIEDGQKAEELTQMADVDPPNPNKPNGSLEEVSDMHGESKKDNNEEEIKRELKDEIPPKPSMLHGSTEEKNNVHSESMKNDTEIIEKLKNYNPENPGETSNSSEEVSNVQSELKQNDKEMSNEVEVNDLLNNDPSGKSDKQNDRSGEVSNVQSQPNDRLEKVSEVTSSSSVEDAEAKNYVSSNKNHKKKSWFFKFNKKN